MSPIGEMMLEQKRRRVFCRNAWFIYRRKFRFSQSGNRNDLLVRIQRIGVGDTDFSPKVFAMTERDYQQKYTLFIKKATTVLCLYDWKSNVRKLESAIEYAAKRYGGHEVLSEYLFVKLSLVILIKPASSFI